MLFGIRTRVGFSAEVVIFSRSLKIFDLRAGRLGLSLTFVFRLDLDFFFWFIDVVVTIIVPAFSLLPVLALAVGVKRTTVCLFFFESAGSDFATSEFPVFESADCPAGLCLLVSLVSESPTIMESTDFLLKESACSFLGGVPISLLLLNHFSCVTNHQMVANNTNSNMPPHIQPGRHQIRPASSSSSS